MSAVLVWWIALDVLALAALPIAWRLLRTLPDAGLAFLRPMGLLAVSLVFWLLAMFGLVRNTVPGILVAWALVALVSALIVRREGRALWRDLVARRGIWLAEEFLFGVALCAWALFRAYNPEIAATEKPMEFGFLNGILRSPTFPPRDPWLSGYGISYYYLGYVMMALVTRLTGLASGVTFNLMGATLFASTVTGTFSVVYNLACSEGVALRARAAAGVGLVGSLFVALMGNLEGVFELVRARGWGSEALWRWLDVKNLHATPPSASWIPDDLWWWWRASRVIHDRDLTGASQEVIDEFPFFSFLLGDNHPHVLALPFLLLAVALGLALLLAPRPAPRSGAPAGGMWRRAWASLAPLGLGPFELLACGLAVGALGFLNTWDYPICLAIVVAGYTLWVYRQRDLGRGWLGETLRFAAEMLATGLIVYLPFYLSFASQAGGIAWAGPTMTRPHQYLLMFGVLIWGLLGLAALGLGRRAGAPREECRWPTSATLVGAGLVGLALASAILGRWTAAGGLALAALLAMLLLWGWIGAPQGASRLGAGTCYALLLALGGLLISISVEFVFLRDSFGTRMNTVFKFYYQGWVLMGLAAAYAAGALYAWARAARPLVQLGAGAWLIVLALLAACGLSYTLAATISKANDFVGRPTLDGVRYVAESRPAEYEAIQWLQRVAPPGAVLVEATGGSYSEYNWISAHTGIPTLLGWGGHEMQWRGNYDEPGRREPDIAAIYQLPDDVTTRAVLDEYGVDYVVFGPREREKYRPNDAAPAKLDRLMRRAFDNGSVIIWSAAP